MRRSWGIALGLVVLAGAAPAAGSAPPDAAVQTPGVPQAAFELHGVPPGFPELPPELERVALRERAAASGSNLMLAQLITPRHKGYLSAIVAMKARPSAKTLLAVAFSRSAAQDTQVQSSMFAWTLGPRALRVGPRLKPASLTTGEGMGTNGSISLRLTEAGKYARTPLRGDCSGAVSFRVGRFTGRVRFHARDQYFKRLDLNRARVLLYREHDLKCTYPPPGPYCLPELSFDAVDEGAGVAVGAFRTMQGRVDQQVVVVGKSGDAIATHLIGVQLAVPEAFEASEDLTSASIDGDAAGPWLSGDLSYVAPPGTDATSEECGPYRESSGVITGNYTAHFDSIGAVSPAQGLAATLRREL